MAREIVVTSVPRGVRPGRTGFQIVMRTAGLREDVCDQLESLAVYRHLPPGLGPNPTRYFHSYVQTSLGPLSVLGRVVDAGADYSSRSNKLAHLVVLDQAEVAGQRGTSPAAALASIEARLATTWQTGPEERQRPLGLDGLPAVRPRMCAGWQRVMGDAGWGGVLADRAISSRPVLLIAANSSPSSCRQLLDLFEESLALLPPERRWGVTFDTTILTAAPLIWRGTYAGSPESSSRQPGLLIIDLSRPQPVPDDMAASPLVQLARLGHAAQQSQRPASTPPQIASRGAPEPAAPYSRPPDADLLTPAGGSPLVPPANRGSAADRTRGRVGSRRLADGSHRYEESNHWQATVAITLILLLLAIAGITTAFIKMDGVGLIQQALAKRVIDAWASQSDGQPPAGFEQPTIDQWMAAFPSADGANDGLARQQIEKVLKPLNESLLRKSITKESLQQFKNAKTLIAAVAAIENLKSVISKEQQRVSTEDLRAALAFQPKDEDEGLIGLHANFFASFLASGSAKADDIKDDDAVRQILYAIQAIQSRDANRPVGAEDRKAISAALKIDYGESSEKVDRLLDELHPEPFADYEESRVLVEECRSLCDSVRNASGERPAIGDALWGRILSTAQNSGIAGNAETVREQLPKRLKAPDLNSVAALMEAIQAIPGSTMPVGGADPAAEEKARAFTHLKEKIAAARKSQKSWWPSDAADQSKALAIFTPLAMPLDIELVVGSNQDFQFTVQHDAEAQKWAVRAASGAESRCVATIDFNNEAMSFRLESKPASDATLHAIRFMPIGFRQPGKPLEGNNWIVLSQPDDFQVDCTEPLTLHDLFCGGKGSEVKLTFGSALAGQRIEWQDHVIQEQAITLTARPKVDGEGAIELQFAATLGGVPLILNESIQVEQAGANLSLKGIPKAWTERKTRFRQIAKSRNDYAAIGFQNNEMKDTDFLSDVLLALLEGYVPNPNKDSHATPLLDIWEFRGPKASLPALREKLIDGLLGGSFGRGSFLEEKEAEFAKQQTEPPSPTPRKGSGEEDAEANQRKVIHDEWVATRSTFIKDALGDPSERKRFLDAREPERDGAPNAKGNKEGPDPELAALHVLSEIDGLIVAKVFRKELEEFLERVPLSALLKGTVVMDWALPDVGEVSVPVSHITPSPVLPERDDGEEQQESVLDE